MDGQAFLAQILAHPGDPLPRLVFADWLEEQGDPRGGLLRWHATTLQDLMRRAVTGTHEPTGRLTNYLHRIQILPHGEQLNRILAAQFVRLTPVGEGRTTWDLLEHPDSRRVIEIAELYGYGLVDDEERKEAESAAYSVAQLTRLAAKSAAKSAALSAAWSAVWSVTTRPLTTPLAIQPTWLAAQLASQSASQSVTRLAVRPTARLEEWTASHSVAQSAQNRMALALLEAKKPPGLVA